MEKHKSFNRITNDFTEEISQCYINQNGIKGQVYSRTISGQKEFYASSLNFGNTFKSFKAADKFMKEKGFASV